MLYNIGEWKSETGLIHNKTSWKLTRDVDGLMIEEEVVESDTSLNAWEVKKIIPTGEIWYVSALRHLIDTAGNDISNNKWIGPYPVISDESNVSDYLAPEFYISEPYINKLAYVPGMGINLSVNMYESNVAYDRTLLLIKDDNNIIIYKAELNLTKDTLDYQIPISAFNFTDKNVLQIEIVNIAKHSTVSPICREHIILKDVYYNIIGNTLGLNPLESNSFTVKGTASLPVIVNSVKLLNTKREFICDCIIETDGFTVPAVMTHNQSYLVETVLEYTDENIKSKLVTDYLYLSTMLLTEKTNIDPNYKYEYTLSQVKSINLGTSNDNLVSDIGYNTEEMFSNLIPIIGKVSNKLDNYIYDSELNNFIVGKSSTYDFDMPHTFRLLTKDRGYLSYSLNDRLVIEVLKYDAYTNTFTNLVTITTNIRTSSGNIGKVVEMNDEYYVFGLNPDNTQEINVYKLDIMSLTLTLIKSVIIDKPLTDLTATSLSDTEIIITPFGEDVNRLYKYNITQNNIDVTLAMPYSFIGTEQMSVKLRNGNILNVKTNYVTSNLEVFYMDTVKNVIEDMSYDLGLNVGVTIQNISMLRNGKVLLTTKTDNHVYIYELK